MALYDLGAVRLTPLMVARPAVATPHSVVETTARPPESGRSRPRRRARLVAAVGTLLDGRYQLVKHIASGGFGSVIEGLDLETGRRVAVKLFDAPPEMEVRFWREVEVLRGLDHPVIVPLLAWGSVPGLAAGGRAQPYFVMEYVEGPTLRDYVTAQPKVLAPLQVLALLRPVAEALDALHKQGIVHRDVKLDNILVADGNPANVRLIDLGIAFSLAESDSRLTLQNHVVASPHYVSPEAARGASPDPTMDCYSLAVCAYELMAGVRPFSGTGIDVIMKKSSAPPPYMSDIGKQCFTVPIERAMRSCLDRNPRARPARATEVIDRLETALRET